MCNINPINGIIFYAHIAHTFSKNHSNSLDIKVKARYEFGHSPKFYEKHFLGNERRIFLHSTLRWHTTRKQGDTSYNEDTAGIN